MLGSRGVRVVVVLVGLALALAVVAPAVADEPLTWGAVARPGDVVQILGSADVPNPAGCDGPTIDLCDRFRIEVVDPGTPFSLSVHVRSEFESSENIDLYVYDPEGNRVAQSTGTSSFESVVVEEGRPGTWEVRVSPVLFLFDVNFSGEVAMLERTRGSVATPIDFVNGTCLEPVPAPLSHSGVSDDGRPVGLDVLVVLDGVDGREAQAELQLAADAYGRLGVDIRFFGFFDAGLPLPSSGRRDADQTMEAVRSLLGGRRPPSADVVYVLTNFDLASAGNNAVAGKADCIGGVRWPEQAFAVGQRYVDREPFHSLTAKVAAHEIGHLLGAHHHYSNCVETVPSVLDEPRYVSACTTMAPDLGLIDLQFSTLSGSVVRGHAVTYAE